MQHFLNNSNNLISAEFIQNVQNATKWSIARDQNPIIGGPVGGTCLPSKEPAADSDRPSHGAQVRRSLRLSAGHHLAAGGRGPGTRTSEAC